MQGDSGQLIKEGFWLKVTTEAEVCYDTEAYYKIVVGQKFVMMCFFGIINNYSKAFDYLQRQIQSKPFQVNVSTRGLL